MTASVEMEDRGTPIFLWTGSYSKISFIPFLGADQRICISVPIGWSLRPDSEEGVILQNLFKTQITAYTAKRWAEEGQGGFLLKWWENWTRPEYSELPHHNFGEDPEFKAAIQEITDQWNEEETKRHIGAHI